MAIVYPQFILIWFHENQLQWLVFTSKRVLSLQID